MDIENTTEPFVELNDGIPLRILLNTSISEYDHDQKNRNKRSIFHLYNMMLCGLKCDPLSFKGYGCYCGLLGSGREVDRIDR